ncbi:uncharacterized protein [Nicotiana sylvestris]|uniref:uncharacterized protein n=1 Tax=Nicotiana sylvestris TaxID=4096 RepID=UPI00388C5412
MDALPDFEEGRSTYRPPRFQKMVSRNRGIPKKGSSSRNTKGYDCCHKCRKPGHFIKDCPLHNQVHYKHNADKVGKRNLVPDRKFKKRDVADNIIKQALVAVGDSSRESEGDNEKEDTFMMAAERKAAKYDSLFALMAKSDEDEEDDDDEVNFFDVQRNLKYYSSKKLMALANILINAYHSLIKEKDALTKKFATIGYERDNLVVVVVNLKETIECVRKEKEVLTKKVVNIEHERDDLSVVGVDLKKTIEELKKESRLGNTQKGKKVASEAYIKLSVKSSLCAELEKNKQLQEELGRVKSDLEKSPK